MIVLYILGGLLALIIGALAVPVRFTVLYDQSLSVTMHLFCLFPVKLVPRDKKEESEKMPEKTEKKKKKKKPAKPSDQSEKHEKKSGNGLSSLIELRGFSGAVELLFDIARRSFGAVRKIMRGVTVTQFDVDARITGEDAADAAVSCGKWNAVLYPVISVILGSVRRYRQNISILPDYLSQENTMSILLKCRLHPISAVWHAAGAAAGFGIKLLRDTIKDKIQQNTAARAAEITKGGAING